MTTPTDPFIAAWLASRPSSEHERLVDLVEGVDALNDHMVSMRLRALAGAERAQAALAEVGLAAREPAQRRGFAVLLQVRDVDEAFVALTRQPADRRAKLLALAGEFTDIPDVADEFAELVIGPFTPTVGLAPRLRRPAPEAIAAIVAARDLELSDFVPSLTALLRENGAAQAASILRQLGEPPLIDDSEATRQFWSSWSVDANRVAMSILFRDGDRDATSDHGRAVVLSWPDAPAVMQTLAGLGNPRVNTAVWTIGTLHRDDGVGISRIVWRLWQQAPDVGELLARAAALRNPALSAMMTSPEGENTRQRLLGLADSASAPSVLALLSRPQVAPGSETFAGFREVWADDDARDALARALSVVNEVATDNQPLALFALRTALLVPYRKEAIKRLADFTTIDQWEEFVALAIVDLLQESEQPGLTDWARKSLKNPGSLLCGLAGRRSHSSLDAEPRPAFGDSVIDIVNVLVAHGPRLPDREVSFTTDEIETWLWLSETTASWDTLAARSPALERAVAADAADAATVRERLVSAFRQMEPSDAAAVIGFLGKVDNPTELTAVVKALALGGEARTLHDQIPLMQPGSVPTNLRLRTVRVALSSVVTAGDGLISALVTGDGQAVAAEVAALGEATKTLDLHDGGFTLWHAVHDADPAHPTPTGLRMAAQRLLLSPDVAPPTAPGRTSDEIARRHLEEVRQAQPAPQKRTGIT